MNGSLFSEIVAVVNELEGCPHRLEGQKLPKVTLLIKPMVFDGYGVHFGEITGGGWVNFHFWGSGPRAVTTYSLRTEGCRFAGLHLIPSHAHGTPSASSRGPADTKLNPIKTLLKVVLELLLDVLEMASRYQTETPSWVLKRGDCIGR